MVADLTVSPLAPKSFPEIEPIDGVELFTNAIAGGYQNRENLLFARFAPDTAVAGVLTTSRCPSAPVDWCRAHLPNGVARGLVVNAGNANAFVGKVGAETVEHTANAAAALLGCGASEVFISSTGVIGEPLDHEPLVEALSCVNGDPSSYEAAAGAIRTTDTFAKGASAHLNIDDVDVSIAGIAKGSGMIAPNMATMLAYLFTDVPISADVLQQVLLSGNAKSFNAITVDSDTSTSDTCLVFATGAAAAKGVAPIIDVADPRCTAFGEALDAVLKDLALQIIKDGEGISKLIISRVTGAESDQSAERIARAIADSPLVKTAVAGADANWGRVVMAVGKAGEPADRDKLKISFGDLVLAENGYRAPHYSEEAASAYMQGDEIEIHVELGLGEGEATIYGADLTHGYVSINGDYRS